MLLIHQETPGRKKDFEITFQGILKCHVLLTTCGNKEAVNGYDARNSIFEFSFHIRFQEF